jgi:hypothetical protein
VWKYAAGLAAVTILPAAVLLYVFSGYWNRPFFFNAYGINPDKGGLPRWRPEPAPIRADDGAYAVVDVYRNVCLVVTGGNASESGRLVPATLGPDVDVSVGWRKLRIPMPENELVVMDQSGVRARETLRAGEALAIFRNLLQRGSDGTMVIDASAAKKLSQNAPDSR